MEPIDYRGRIIEIIQDQDPQNPLEMGDHFCKLACFHRRYDLGHKHDFSVPSELRMHMERTKAVYLPLYLYDHSGITMKTSPFHCPWDSGQVGFVYAEAEAIRKEYGKLIITKSIRDKVTKYMQAVVEDYDHYLTGNVWGYVIKSEDGEVIDSCWGYYGDPGVAEKAAMEFIDADLEQALHEKVQANKDKRRGKFVPEAA